MTGIILGLDSSCYTTSVAAVSQEGKVMADKRQVLTVKPGTIGLRQQEALFQHWHNFPRLLKELTGLSDAKVVAVATAGNRPIGQVHTYLFSQQVAVCSIFGSNTRYTGFPFHPSGRALGCWSIGSTWPTCYFFSGGTFVRRNNRNNVGTRKTQLF